MVGLLQAVPRSRLYERLRREGRLRGESGGENTSVNFNFVPRPRVGATEVKAFLRSLWLMGVRLRGRRAYWRFMISALRHHHAQFGLAMTLAIYGHHFRNEARSP